MYSVEERRLASESLPATTCFDNSNELSCLIFSTEGQKVEDY